MVSIFGLKIGGDKKKKPGQPSPKPPQQTQAAHQEALAASKVSFGNQSQGNSNNDNLRPIPRTAAPNQDLLTTNSHALQAFYSPGSQPLASASMQDLARTTSNGDLGFHALKPASSNPNFGVRWDNGSTPNLAAISPENQLPSSGAGRQRPWVDPLDVHFAREQQATFTPKSPLSQFEQIDDNKPFVSSTIRESALPMGLDINKLSAPAIPPRSALRNPPSPPPSLKTASEKGSTDSERFSVLERPIIPAAAGEGRPSSRGSHRNVPTSLRELMAADGLLLYDTVSVPTPPPSLPRASNETGNRASMNEWGEPVIQSVRAKRETMTVSPARQQSLERLIDSFDRSAKRSATLDDAHRPRTSSGPRPLRPKPLNLDTGSRSADGNGPSSAPFGPIQRTASPAPLSPRRMPRTGVPAAAVGAHGRPMRFNTRGTPRPSADEYGVAPERPPEDTYRDDSPPGSPVQQLLSPITRFSLESLPDSPIMPLDGPLANSERLESPPSSPILPLISPVAIAGGGSPPDSPILPLVGPMSSSDHLESPPDSPIIPLDGPLANSEYLESPPDSPIMPSAGPLSTPLYSPVHSRVIEDQRDQLDTGFPFPDWSTPLASRSNSEASVIRPLPADELALAESVNWPLNAPVAVAPIFPAPESPSLSLRSQSPFPIPSFSRPWTPTNARPGTPVGMSVKTTELTIPACLRVPSPSPRRPPPRTVPEYALRNPPVAKNHTGAGFI